MEIWTWVGRGIGLLLAMVFISLAVIIGIYQLTGFSFVSSRPPAGLGLKDGRLSPCPNPPLSRWGKKENCVSSLDKGTEYYIEPIEFRPHLESDKVLQKIAAAIDEHPQITVREVNDHYMRFEWSSQLFGFVDDVELWWRPELERIEVRSASRLGRKDFGANRLHVEWLRAVLKEHRFDILHKQPTKTK